MGIFRCCDQPTFPNAAVKTNEAEKKVLKLDKMIRVVCSLALLLFATTIILVALASNGNVHPIAAFYTFVGSTVAFFATKIIGTYRDAFANNNNVNSLKLSYMARNSKEK